MTILNCRQTLRNSCTVKGRWYSQGEAVADDCLHSEADSPGHWFSKCGPQTSSISIIWKLVRNANSQDILHIHRIRDSEPGPWQSVSQALHVTLIHAQIEKTLPQTPDPQAWQCARSPREL